jgi:hypothetical protein
VVASILTNPPITTIDTPAYLRWAAPGVGGFVPASGVVPAEPELPEPTPLPPGEPPRRKGD